VGRNCGNPYVSTVCAWTLFKKKWAKAQVFWAEIDQAIF